MPAINRLPRVANAVVTYVGELATNRFISFVDASLNSNNPCVDAPTAAATADTQHSGAITASGKEATVPQASGNLLDVTKTFAICYAETSGSTSDSSWRDSYVRVKASKIETFSAHLVAHKTYGSLAAVSTLAVQYAGSLAASMWVSMVDATSNSNFPCALGSNAAQSAGAAASPPTSPSSGVDQADGSSVVVFDTTVMDTSLTYAAVSYTHLTLPTILRV